MDINNREFTEFFLYKIFDICDNKIDQGIFVIYSYETIDAVLRTVLYFADKDCDGYHIEICDAKLSNSEYYRYKYKYSYDKFILIDILNDVDNSWHNDYNEYDKFMKDKYNVKRGEIH